MESQIYKEVTLWHGITSLPSSWVDGWVLPPFHYTWEVLGIEAQTRRTSQVRLTELCYQHSGTFWDLGLVSVWEKVTWTSSYLVMALSTLLCSVSSLYINYIWVTRGKPAFQSGSNWKGKTPLGKQWQGGYRPISAPVTCLVLPRGSSVWLTVA